MKIILMAQHRTRMIFLLLLFTISSLLATNESRATETAQIGWQVSKYWDNLAKSQVETAWSMLKAIYAKHKNGELTLEQSKELGADLLRELRYGASGYFWADTVDGVNVVLYGKKESEGKNRYDAQDIKGTLYVRDFITKGKQPGGGYTEYWYPKLGGNTPLHKRSYVLLFEPFGWVIGTGYYVDDIAK